MTVQWRIYAFPGLRELTRWPLGNLNEILEMWFPSKFSDWWLSLLFRNCPNIRIRFGLQIVLVCLYSTLSHYHHCANLSEGIWIYKMPVRYILSSVCVIHYTICGAVRFQFTHFSCDDWDNIYTLSYNHHQIGSMNYYPLFRVRSWNNGVRCMSFYTLINVTGLHRWAVNISSGNDLGSSGSKPLPEPMLTQIYVAIWRHQATMA